MRKITTLTATLATTLLLSTGASAGQLALSDGFFATAVNGDKVSVHADAVTLSQGKQIVTVRYEQNIIHNREQNEYTVSKPMHLVFDAQGNANYTITKTEQGVALVSNNQAVPVEVLTGDAVIHRALAL
ncbi:DUF2057 family protein [Ferrimonas marina]|uniref:DUF2057 domain-containing protein n=1 Tax=Ferrimonas marina TaxID=299255 RepID=A0A1M5XBS1_9GAMM|nr:DUF2057 family protein [Ferrimonas marina]SHH97092.1 hypothetical protein SAMN02745129_3405 [Ferrimonas marina]